MAVAERSRRGVTVAAARAAQQFLLSLHPRSRPWGLLPNQPVNRLTGRVNAILFGPPFDLLRQGHLLYQAASRTQPERCRLLPGSTDLYQH